VFVIRIRLPAQSTAPESATAGLRDATPLRDSGAHRRKVSAAPGYTSSTGQACTSDREVVAAGRVESDFLVPEVRPGALCRGLDLLTAVSRTGETALDLGVLTGRPVDPDVRIWTPPDWRDGSH
jgi:hypothetical protein